MHPPNFAIMNINPIKRNERSKQKTTHKLQLRNIIKMCYKIVTSSLLIAAWYIATSTATATDESESVYYLPTCMHIYMLLDHITCIAIYLTSCNVQAKLCELKNAVKGFV